MGENTLFRRGLKEMADGDARPSTRRTVLNTNEPVIEVQDGGTLRQVGLNGGTVQVDSSGLLVRAYDIGGDQTVLVPVLDETPVVTDSAGDSYLAVRFQDRTKYLVLKDTIS